MRDLADGTLPNDHIRLAAEDRLNQRLNVTSVVLIIAIGVDDDVSTAG